MISQILSIAFELAEYSLQHQLPNFAEVRGISQSFMLFLKNLMPQCWWDHVRSTVQLNKPR